MTVKKYRGADFSRRQYLTFEQEQEKAQKDRIKQNEYRKNNYRKKAAALKAEKEAQDKTLWKK